MVIKRILHQLASLQLYIFTSSCYGDLNDIAYTHRKCIRLNEEDQTLW